MAKRYTDTDKWKKPFIRSMKAPYKLLWLYILDECDHAGIWQVDFDVAQIKIGEKLNLEVALKFFGNRVQVLNSGSKWFVFDFIEFQYGDLNPQNRVHKSVITILEKYNVDYQNKPLASPFEGAKDKEQDKDKDKIKDKDIPTEAEFLNYCQTFLSGTYLSYEKSLKAKYLQWIENRWRDGYNKPIINWRTKAQNVVPFLKPEKIVENKVTQTINAHELTKQKLGIHE